MLRTKATWVNSMMPLNMVYVLYNTEQPGRMHWSELKGSPWYVMKRTVSRAEPRMGSRDYKYKDIKFYGTSLPILHVFCSVYYPASEVSVWFSWDYRAGEQCQGVSIPYFPFSANLLCFPWHQVPPDPSCSCSLSWKEIPSFSSVSFHFFQHFYDICTYIYHLILITSCKLY